MTQILILCLGSAAFAARLRQKKVLVLEWGLLLFVAANIVLVQAQMFFGEKGKIAWYLRYHQAALTLLYGWTAWGAMALIRSLKGKWRYGFICILAIWFTATGGTSLWRIVKQKYVDSSRSARAKAAEWAAQIIKEDWTGPAEDKTRFFTISDYHPRARPIVAAAGALPAYLAKGRWLSLSPVIRAHESPDYALWPIDAPEPKGMVKIGEQAFGRKNRRFVLYKKASTPQRERQ